MGWLIALGATIADKAKRIPQGSVPHSAIRRPYRTSRFYTDHTGRTAYELRRSQGNLLKIATTYDTDKRHGGRNHWWADGQQDRRVYVHIRRLFGGLCHAVNGYITVTTPTKTSREHLNNNQYLLGKTRVEPFSIHQQLFVHRGLWSYLRRLHPSYMTMMEHLISSPSNPCRLLRYDYDSAGDLTKMIPRVLTDHCIVWTYQKNQLVDYVEKSGTTELPTATLFRMVMIIPKAVTSGSYG